jgi:ferredoxin
MITFFRQRPTALQVDLCERCGQVCNAACRAKATRRELQTQMQYGWRVV